MNSTLTKALMKYYNDFFTLSPEDQDIWKLQDHSEIDDKVRDYVSEKLGFNDDTIDAEKQYEYNVIMLDYCGIGPDKFMMNEIGWDIKDASHDSLYSYNVYYHNWQEKAFAEDDNFIDSEDDNTKSYVPDELYNRYANWARAIVNGKFHYLNLDSLQIWIQWALDEVSYDWMEINIPHDYVDGPNNGKKVDGGSLWDMRLDAYGLEGWYEQMRDFGYEWTHKQFKKEADLGDVVFVIDKTEKFYDPTLDYVFGSLNVLKKLTFVNFVQDCEKVKGDNDVLIAHRDKISAEFKAALNAKFEEVKKTPANVVKLKKKRKVIMSDQAVEDLEGLDE